MKSQKLAYTFKTMKLCWIQKNRLVQTKNAFVIFSGSAEWLEEDNWQDKYGPTDRQADKTIGWTNKAKKNSFISCDQPSQTYREQSLLFTRNFFLIFAKSKDKSKMWKFRKTRHVLR